MDEEKGLTQIYCGPGKGKTSVAIGQAIRAIGHGKRAIVIQFLKGRATSKLDYLSALEPDVRLFRFEKKDNYYEDLTPEEKLEENLNIRNGLNFARKVLATEECDMLIDLNRQNLNVSIPDSWLPEAMQAVHFPESH